MDPSTLIFLLFSYLIRKLSEWRKKKRKKEKKLREELHAKNRVFGVVNNVLGMINNNEKHEKAFK